MPSDAKTLNDIRDNIIYAQSFVLALSFDNFKVSKLHFYATTRAVEIVSEASRRLPDELRERHPHLPWRAMRDSGNVYRHEYDTVAEAAVWRTVYHDLLPLYEVVMAEIKALDVEA